MSEPSHVKAERGRLEPKAMIERLHRERIELAAEVSREQGLQHELITQIEALTKEVDQLRNLIADQREKASDARARLSSVQTSLSWRLTTPLRALGRCFPLANRQVRRLSLLTHWTNRLQLGSRLSNARMLRKNAELLKAASGLFDRDWYLEQNPDVAASGVDPFVHYLRRGASEGRDPNPYFDTDWYLAEYPEVSAAGVNPLAHYYHWGASEGRDPSRLFDTDWYASRNVDVTTSGINPLQHFLGHGRNSGQTGRPVASEAWKSGGSAEQLILRSEVAVGANPRIAVMLHVFYQDLLIEMLDATLTIPYPFDIMLSTPFREVAENAINWAEQHQRVRLTGKVVPNRGRDVAPMMITFGRSLLEYDVFCHLHAKKSLHSGEDQQGWRHHLVSTLLGSSERVSTILHLLLHERFGVVYPKTYPSMPYFAHTWLSSRAAGEKLFERLGLEDEFTGYLDFPIGTMFWARPQALLQLLDGRFTLLDFPEEHGENDGTLAHAVERSIVSLAKANGWSSAEVDFDARVLRRDHGSRNLEQYSYRNLTELIERIDRSDIVSFDIFDTLITRPLVRPDHLFAIIERKLDQTAGHPTHFVRCRQEAERIARSKSPRLDVSMDHIYEEVAGLGTFDRQLAAEAQILELDLEYDMAIPRERLIEAYRHALKAKKRVLLVSDMYLPSTHIAKMLTKVGVSGWSELYVSCEVGFRKDTGEMWDWLIDKENLRQHRLLHIGDNEQSDAQMPGDRRIIDLYHVMSPVNLFALSKWGRLTAARLGPKWRDEEYLGPVISRLYNDPFRKVDFD